MQRPSLRVLAKYFLHGVGFTALLTIVALLSAFLLALLAVVGSYLGIIIGLAVLVVLIGVANTYITQFLWFRVETSLTKYLYQGILLLVLLVLVELPFQYFYMQSSQIRSLSPLLSAAILFVASSFINGFLGKRTASIWKLSEPRAPSNFRRAPTRSLASPNEAPAKPVETVTTPIAPLNPEEELKREEAKLELLLKHRQKTGLLNPETLDNLIETQKRIVETLRQASTDGKS